MKHVLVLILLGAAAILFAIEALTGRSVIAAGLALVSAALFVERMG